MIIDNLETMENIVENSPELHWEGWDVVKYTETYKGMFSANGAYKDGKWYKKRVFPITENGWEIPGSIGQKNAVMER
jgi:hypothetical protein